MQEGLEQILSEARFDGKRALFSLWNHGTFFDDSMQYVFTTGDLSPDRAEKIIAQIKRNPVFNGCKVEHVNKVKRFHVVHVTGPASIREELNRQFSYISRKTGRKNNVFRADYTEQITEFAARSSVVSTNPEFLNYLALKREFEQGLERLRENIRRLLGSSVKHQNYCSAVFNRLNYLFIEGQVDELEKDRYTRTLPNEIIEERRRLHDIFMKVKEKHKAEFNPKNSTLDIIVNAKDVMTVRKMPAQMTHEEWMEQKWLFVDIEVPFWENPDKSKREISWVGMCYYERGKEKKEIHTLSSLDAASFKGYEIHVHKDEKTLLDAVQNSVLRENPYTVSSFNTAYDLVKIREAIENPASKKMNRKVRPVIETTGGAKKPANPEEDISRAFQRIGIRGREVVDLLKWAQLAYHFHPRHKLEVIAKSVLGEESFEKAINYVQLRELEERARNGDAEAARTIASYLADDVDTAKKIFLHQKFQSHLKLGAIIAEEFKRPLSHVLYSAAAINKAQARDYFHAVGLLMDEIYRAGKKFKEERTKARKGFKELMTKKLSGLITAAPGEYHNVRKAYIPHGYHLRHQIRRRFPLGDKLFRLYESAADNHDRFLVARYINAMADLMAVAYDKSISAYSDFKEGERDTQTEFGKLKEKQLKELEEKAEKEGARFGGNYAVSLEEMYYALKVMQLRWQIFSKNHNLTMLHYDGEYAYFTGGNEEDFRQDCPFVLVDNIDHARLVRKKDQSLNLVYQKYGHFRKRYPKSAAKQGELFQGQSFFA